MGECSNAGNSVGKARRIDTCDGRAGTCQATQNGKAQRPVGRDKSMKVIGSRRLIERNAIL